MAKPIPLSKVITLAFLQRHGACEEEWQRFRRIFGKKAALTYPNILKALEGGLLVNWLVPFVIRNDPRAGKAYYDELEAIRTAYSGWLAPEGYSPTLAESRRGAELRLQHRARAFYRVLTGKRGPPLPELNPKKKAKRPSRKAKARRVHGGSAGAGTRRRGVRRPKAGPARCDPDPGK